MTTPPPTAQQLQARLLEEEIVISEETAQEWVGQFGPDPTVQPGDGRAWTIPGVVRQDQRLKKITSTMPGGYTFSSVRIQYLNELVVKTVSEFLGQHYERPRTAQELAFDEMMSDPYEQAKWFEELDIMN